MLKEWQIEQVITRADLGYVRAADERRARRLVASELDSRRTGPVGRAQNRFQFRLVERSGTGESEAVILY